MGFSKEYYKANRDSIIRKQKEYRIKHIDTIRKKDRTRSTKNRRHHIKLEREWRQRHPQKQKEYKRVLSNRYRNSILLAKQRNKLFCLKFDQYTTLINSGCYYCSESLLSECGIGLDRIDNKKNYTSSNVFPCCARCNDVRGNKYTIEQMKVIGKAVREALDNMKGRN